MRRSSNRLLFCHPERSVTQPKGPLRGDPHCHHFQRPKLELSDSCRGCAELSRIDPRLGGPSAALHSAQDDRRFRGRSSIVNSLTSRFSLSISTNASSSLRLSRWKSTTGTPALSIRLSCSVNAAGSGGVESYPRAVPARFHQTDAGIHFHPLQQAVPAVHLTWMSKSAADPLACCCKLSAEP